MAEQAAAIAAEEEEEEEEESGKQAEGEALAAQAERTAVQQGAGAQAATGDGEEGVAAIPFYGERAGTALAPNPISRRSNAALRRLEQQRLRVRADIIGHARINM